MSKDGREMLQEMDNGDMLDFGKFIKSEFVHEVLGLEYPPTATKQVYDRLALEEMAAVDYVRNVLLGRGMYIRGVAGGYRILTITENVEQVSQYLTSADRKIRRGLKLLKNSPRERGAYPDQQEARAELKLEHIREHRNKFRPSV